MNFMVMLLLASVALVTASASLGAALIAEQMTSAIPIIGEFIQLSLSHNRGIAFSIALPSPLQEILVAGALIAVCFIAVKTKLTKFLSVAFGFIIGGAVGNLVNRALIGAVTDFISVGSFPVFNLADAAITIGAGLLLAESFLKKKG